MCDNWEQALLALKLGQAAGLIFGGQNGHPVLIGKDTRRSNYATENALGAGFLSVGMNVLETGPLPKPAVAMLTHSMRTALGVMISAPDEDNPVGVTFFGSNGKVAPEAKMQQCRELMNDDLAKNVPKGLRPGRAERIEGALERYVESTKRALPNGIELGGLRVVVDCAHGAAYKTAPTTLAELGAEVVPLGVQPDGYNIGRECGLQHPNVLSQTIWEVRADVGVSFDESGSNLVLMDERRQLIPTRELHQLIKRHRKVVGEFLTGDPFVWALQMFAIMKKLGKKASTFF